MTGQTRSQRKEHAVLTLSPAAVTAIRSLTAQPGTPDDIVVRIAPQADDASSLALTLSEHRRRRMR